MVERIKEILQANQLTPTQFADSIGVARPIISHILSGRNKPSLEVVQKIVAAFPQLSLDWLLRGAGSMLSATPAATPAATPVTTPAAAVQSAVAAALPTEEPSTSTLPAQKAAKAPRYRPQPASVLSVQQPGAGSVPGAPAAYRPFQAGAVAPSTPTATPSGASGSQSDVAVAAVAASVPKPLVSESVDPAVAAPPVAAPPVVAAPVQAPDVSLATAFAEPGKTIRRIVIFYQDGTFTDYQPELGKS